jgi:hypothetical protein
MLSYIMLFTNECVYGQHTNHAAYGGARYNASDAAGQTSAGGRSDRCRRVELAKDL